MMTDRQVDARQNYSYVSATLYRDMGKSTLTYGTIGADLAVVIWIQFDFSQHNLIPYHKVKYQRITSVVFHKLVWFQS